MRFKQKTGAKLPASSYNIRELKNVIERTMILAPDGDIDTTHLPMEIREYAGHPQPRRSEPQAAGDEPEGRFVELRELEDHYIDEVLAAVGGNKSRAARILGIHSTSLLRHLKKKSKGTNGSGHKQG